MNIHEDKIKNVLLKCFDGVATVGDDCDGVAVFFQDAAG
jgi:hypothetical protein